MPCNWIKVRNLPEGCPNWYQSTDKMVGTDFFGDSTDDLVAWSI